MPRSSARAAGSAVHAVSSAASAPASGPLLSIGQVLARLSGEFPEVTPSKLRFLEEQGLVSPARTASGYRKFSSSDVERLRLVLGMQRDHYLPLKVIRAYVDDVDAGLEPELPGVSTSRAASLLSTARRLDREELAREAKAPVSLVHEAVSAGLLPIAEHYGDDALATVTALVELGRSGIEPRHLRAVKASVDREIALVEAAVAPLRRRSGSSSGARATDSAVEISNNLSVVRSHLLRAALARLGR